MDGHGHKFGHDSCHNFTKLGNVSRENSSVWDVASWVVFGFKTLNLKCLCLANLAMNHCAEIPKMATYSVYESNEPDPSYFPGHNIVKYGKIK